MQCRFIVLSGRSGSGKTYAARFMSKVYGYQHIMLSDVIRGIAAHTPHNKPNIIAFALWYRQKYGKDVFARQALKHVKKDRVVFDGVRCVEEYEVIKQKCPHTCLVWIQSHNPAIHRHTRTGFDDTRDAPMLEQALNLEKLKVLADRVLYNEHTPAFDDQLRDLVSSFE